jgi:hypothetical protein
MGCLTAALGVVALIVMGSIATFVGASQADYSNGIAPSLLAAIGLAAAVFFLALAAPSIIGGWGLMKYRPWSRILMIIVSIFHLLHIPLGTALGVYGLWVLFSEDGRRILESGGQMYFPPATYPAAAPPQQPTYPPPGV